MEYDKRAMTEAEDKYTFSQHPQIANQCGLIGYLRADMDTDGNGFFSTWNGFRDDLKTDEFKAELDDVINSLREEGDILHSRNDLAKYCRTTPQSKMKGQDGYYGVRVDTDKYSYLLRLNPNRGEYNLYCYCYTKSWLNDHMRRAQRGIRFITPSYKNVFKLADGDRVRIKFADGEYQDYTCRYVDDYHLEVGHDLFHICEFAERMKQSGNEVIPLRANLPDQCYSTLDSTGEIIIIKRGESGYYKTDIPTTSKDETTEIVNLYNSRLGVSRIQEAAMKAGSMFGFDTPAADPASYNEQGKLKNSREKSRDDAR